MSRGNYLKSKWTTSISRLKHFKSSAAVGAWSWDTGHGLLLLLCTSATNLWRKGRRTGLRTGIAFLVKSKRPLLCTPLSPLWLLCFFKSVSKGLSNLTIPRLKYTVRGNFFTHLVYIFTVLRLTLGPHNTEKLHFIWSGLSGQCFHPMYISCVC